MFLNKVMLIGNVGKDPDIKYIDNGVATATLSLATTNPGYTLPNGTQVPDRTEWHSVRLWNRLAEIVERYVHKGDKLYIEGQLRTRSYTDKKGNTRYVTEVWADNMRIMHTPRNTSASTPAQEAATGTTGNAPTVATSTAPEECPF